jgi:cysteine desulfurase
VKIPIYMDHQSTTPVDPRVLDAMLPFLRERFGNASSHSHALGWDARDAVEQARTTVAETVGAVASEIVFTSGATESDNTAVIGLAEGARERGDHIISATTEHRAVLDPLVRLEEMGYRVSRVRVDGLARVDPAEIESAISERTILVTLMTANNEVGTIHDIEAVGRITRRHGVLFHTDAVQAIGKIPFNVTALGVDAASISAHKIYGPKGVGALYVRGDPAVRLKPLLLGGGHEGGLRSGTPNVPGIVGFARAAKLAAELHVAETSRVAALRDRLWATLQSEVDGTRLNGCPTARLPNNLNVSFEGIDGEALLASVEEVSLSTGSACMSANQEPSYVLAAMGLSRDRIRGSVRFGLGRFNTAEEVDYVAQRIAEAVRALRGLAPRSRERRPEDRLAAGDVDRAETGG